MPDALVSIEGRVATVTIDRPPVNALTIDSYREIATVFADVAAREDVHCIVLTATGKRAFCAGFDFRQFAAAGGTEDDPSRPEVLRAMFETVRTCSVPVIAALNGPAIGAGCVLAAVCDIRIGGDNASFGLPEIDFGRIGGAAYLASMVSPGRLRQMVFTGEPMSARQALHEGLLTDLVDADQVVNEAMKIAIRIAAKSRLALCEIKKALTGLADLSIEDGYRLEQDRSQKLRLALEGAVQ